MKGRRINLYKSDEKLTLKEIKFLNDKKLCRKNIKLIWATDRMVLHL